MKACNLSVRLVAATLRSESRCTPNYFVKSLIDVVKKKKTHSLLACVMLPQSYARFTEQPLVRLSKDLSRVHVFKRLYWNLSFFPADLRPEADQLLENQEYSFIFVFVFLS